MTLAVVVSGDLHHYSATRTPPARHRITAGGGGAYLYPTHHLDAEIELEEGRKETKQSVSYRLQAEYPAGRVSSLLSWAATWRLPSEPWHGRLPRGALRGARAAAARAGSARHRGRHGHWRRAPPRLGRLLEQVGDLRRHGGSAPVRALRGGTPRAGPRADRRRPHRPARVRARAGGRGLGRLLVGVLSIPAWTIAIAALAAVLAAPFGAGILGLYLALADLASRPRPIACRGSTGTPTRSSPARRSRTGRASCASTSTARPADDLPDRNRARRPPARAPVRPDGRARRALLHDPGGGARPTDRGSCRLRLGDDAAPDDTGAARHRRAPGRRVQVRARAPTLERGQRQHRQPAACRLPTRHRLHRAPRLQPRARHAKPRRLLRQPRALPPPAARSARRPRDVRGRRARPVGGARGAQRPVCRPRATRTSTSSST